MQADGRKNQQYSPKKIDHKFYQFEEFAATTIGTRFFFAKVLRGEHGKYRWLFESPFWGSLPQFSLENRVLNLFYHFSPWQN